MTKYFVKKVDLKRGGWKEKRNRESLSSKAIKIGWIGGSRSVMTTVLRGKRGKRKEGRVTGRTSLPSINRYPPNILTVVTGEDV